MSLRKIFYKLSLYLFYPCPVKSSKIVFMNFSGKGYGDNPKYIAEEIIHQKKKWDLVWLVSDMNANFPEEIRKVKFGSIKMKYELQTAAVIVTNCQNPLSFKKKKHQFIIQTWHAPMSYKKIEYDARDFLRPSYLKVSNRNNEMTDLFISSNAIQTEEYKRAFRCKSEIMQCGIPRNDIYFNISEQQKSEIKKRIGLDDKTKILFYAPTFRDIDSGYSYNIDGKRLLEVLRNKTYQNWKLLIRFHPAVREWDYDKKIFEDDNIINMTAFPDMQELLIASDMVITDISSSIYDCILIRKPLLLFMPDFEFYSKNCRGFTDEFNQLPYVIYKTNDELIEAINHYDHEKMIKIQDAYIKRVNGADDGHSAEKIVSRIQKQIENKNYAKNS